jgi:hypothetical protein
MNGERKNDVTAHSKIQSQSISISKIPFFPRNFLATQTVEKIKKIQANPQMYHI